MAWKDVKKYLENDKRVVIVLGATEEHSDLSLCTDTLIPSYIAEKACEITNVLMLPALPFGISHWSYDYPGTISLRTSTYVDLITDIIDSILQSGFRKIIVLNGHGFNRSICPLFIERFEKYDDAEACFLQWYDLSSFKEYQVKKGIVEAHANWAECFPFTKLNNKRENIRNDDLDIPNFLQSPSKIKEYWVEGHGPGKLEISEDDQKLVLDALVNEFASIINKYK